MLEQRRIEHFRVRGGLIRTVFVNVPTAKDEILNPRERNKFVDLRRASVGSLPDANRTELSQRADGQTETSLYCFNARDEVVLTAPIPGIRTPNLPSEGAIRTSAESGAPELVLLLALVVFFKPRNHVLKSLYKI